MEFIKQCKLWWKLQYTRKKWASWWLWFKLWWWRWKRLSNCDIDNDDYDHDDDISNAGNDDDDDNWNDEIPRKTWPASIGWQWLASPTTIPHHSNHCFGMTMMMTTMKITMEMMSWKCDFSLKTCYLKLNFLKKKYNFIWIYSTVVLKVDRLGLDENLR